MIFSKKCSLLYYANVTNLNLEKAYKLLPPFRQKKADDLLRDNDKKLSAGVYLLLCKALAINGINIDNYEFTYHDAGKPYLKGCPFHISYSHSGEYVLVGLSQFSSIGVDIQEMNEVNSEVQRLAFNSEDIVEFNKLGKDKKAFYKIWCLKEAFGKLSGKGLSKNTIVDYSSKNTYLKQHKNYMIAATSNNKHKIKEIHLNF